MGQTSSNTLSSLVEDSTKRRATGYKRLLIQYNEVASAELELNRFSDSRLEAARFASRHNLDNHMERCLVQIIEDKLAEYFPH